MATHYEILHLDHSKHKDEQPDPLRLKKAYHKALLRNHPDKRSTQFQSHCVQTNTNGTSDINAYTIDQINWAYACLSSPELKREYDNSLLISSSAPSSAIAATTTFRTGLDTIDLDDMQYHENVSKFTKSCRCGEEEGFTLTEKEMSELEDELEDQLKRQSQNRAMLVGCCGCSLWLRIEWVVMDDNDEEEQKD